MPESSSALTDFATLAFVIAHGADGSLDSREVGVLARRVESLAASLDLAPLSGANVSEVVRAASQAYLGLAVPEINGVLDRLGRGLDERQRAEVYGAFVEIAAADGTLHRMEQTFLRHIATAWHMD